MKRTKTRTALSARGSIVLALSCCCWPLAPSFAADRAAAQREAAACGPRAVYLLLNHLGIPATYAEIRDAIPLSDQGASIAELQRCLRSFGVECSIRRLNPTEMLTVRTPMIAYLSHLYVGNTAGHFLFVPSMRPGGPDTVDPVTGRRGEPWNWRSFSDAWSGVCLVVERPPGVFKDLPLLAAMLNLGLFAVVFTGTPIRWRRRAYASASCICLFLYPGTGAVMAESGPPREGLRSNARGGVNAAALMLACAKGDANDLFNEADMTAGAASSVDDVRGLLAQRGCETVLRRLTLDELSRAAPAIVLLRGGPDREGEYCLVLAAADGGVSLVRAGAMAVSVVPIDEFRYRWTGHALLRDRAGSVGWSHAGGLLAVLAVGVVIGAGAAVRRSIAGRRKPFSEARP